MKSLHMMVAMLIILVTQTAKAGEPKNAWKFFGGTETDACFYDEKGVKRKDDLVTVWAKCLSQAELNNFDLKKAKKLNVVEEAATRIGNYYLPPIAYQMELNAEQLQHITLYEVLAEKANLKPHVQVLYTVGCKTMKVGTTHLTLYTGNKIQSKDNVLAMEYTPPETNADRLLKLVCEQTKDWTN